MSLQNAVTNTSLPSANIANASFSSKPANGWRRSKSYRTLNGFFRVRFRFVVPPERKTATTNNTIKNKNTALSITLRVNQVSVVNVGWVQRSGTHLRHAGAEAEGSARLQSGFSQKDWNHSESPAIHAKGRSNNLWLILLYLLYFSCSTAIFYIQPTDATMANVHCRPYNTLGSNASWTSLL